MVEVGKIGNKTLVMDGKILSLFKGGSLLRQMYYGGYEDFDNANGGVWKKYINIPIIETPLDYSVYIIEIDNLNVNVLNYGGELKVSAPISSEFWQLVRSDGNDIRFFNHLLKQQWFFIEKFDYVNKYAKIFVKLEPNSKELNIAFGNEMAYMSNYNNSNEIFNFYRYDPFDTFDTNFWTHVEGTSVGVSSNTYVSPPTSLRLYYSAGAPWHADAQASLPTGLPYWYMEWWWKNTSSDTIDPDRGGGGLIKQINYYNVGMTIVYPNKIDYIIGRTVVYTEYGNFTNVWLHFKIIYNNGQVKIYREINGDWVLKASGTSPEGVGAIILGMAGYNHEEYVDDLYLYSTQGGDFAIFDSPRIMEF